MKERHMKHSGRPVVGLSLLLVGILGAVLFDTGFTAIPGNENKNFDGVIRESARRMVEEGRQTFRFDTFGDEAFWGDTLKLHQAIVGAKQGGIGLGVSPKTALSVG